MKDKLTTKVKGHLKVTNLTTGKVMYDGPNAINPQAASLLSTMIGGANKIDTMKAFAAGVPLASAPITVASQLTPGQVGFKAIFNQLSFNGVMDEIKLLHEGTSEFSKKTGLSIAKDQLTSMSVEWRITINI